MELPIFVLNFASGISMLLVIYAAYMLVHDSKGDLAKAFKIILLGHVPSAVIHFFGSLAYFDVNVLPETGSVAYALLNYTAEVISALSVFLAIYVIKRALFDKIAQFRMQAGKGDGK